MLKPIKKVRQAFRQYTGSPVWPVTLCSCTTVCIYIRITMVRVHEYEGNHTSVFMVHSTRQESSIRCSAGRGRTMGNNTSALAPQTNNKQSFSFNSQSTDFCINFRQFFFIVFYNAYFKVYICISISYSISIQQLFCGILKASKVINKILKPSFYK